MSGRVSVKICGLTSAEAVAAAVESGADAVGFVFAPSPRRVTAERAAALASDVPAGVERVAVFRTPSALELETVLASFAPDRVQADAGAFRGLAGRGWPPFLPAFHDGPDLLERIQELAEREGESATVLIDGPVSGAGRRCDWERAARAARRVRVILAGGLDPGNVGEAIRAVRPAGVDVSSGVERSPGVKDPARIAAFVAAARAAQEGS